MWSGVPRIFFVLTLVLNCILWSQSRYAQVKGPTRSLLVRRSDLAINYGVANVSLGGHDEDEVCIYLVLVEGFTLDKVLHVVPPYSLSNTRPMRGSTRLMFILRYRMKSKISQTYLVLLDIP